MSAIGVKRPTRRKSMPSLAGNNAKECASTAGANPSGGALDGAGGEAVSSQGAASDG